MTGVADEEGQVVAKAARRIIPFLAVLYFISFLDRVNVGYAALTMSPDIGLSATAYGFGAGVFFLGYCLFEVPSNLILTKVGARRWIARIMISWGLVSAGMSLVWDPASFWVMRFLLGVAEAGFFPGIVLYLSTWFPRAVRGRILGSFLIAVPVSNVLGAPLSAWLLQTSFFGLAGWRSMFIVEGVPAVLLGISVLYLLPDRPGTAKWLGEREREVLERLMEREQATAVHSSLRAGLTSPMVWVLGLAYFGVAFGIYGVALWIPQFIRAASADLSITAIGWLSAIPYFVAAVAMVAWARHSDRTGERHLHVAIGLFVGAAGFLGCAYVGGAAATIACLVVATVGVLAAFAVFWTLPTALLAGSAAATGIALINSIANLSGYVGPIMVGYLKDSSGDFDSGLTMVAACLALAGALVLGLRVAYRPPAALPA